MKVIVVLLALVKGENSETCMYCEGLFIDGEFYDSLDYEDPESCFRGQLLDGLGPRLYAAIQFENFSLQEQAVKPTTATMKRATFSE